MQLPLLTVAVLDLAQTLHALVASPRVLGALSGGGSADTIISFPPLDIQSHWTAVVQPALHLLNELEQPRGSNSNAIGKLKVLEERTVLVALLKEHAKGSQKRIIEELELGRVDYESFWINNSLHIKNMTAPLYSSIVKAIDTGVSTMLLNKVAIDVDDIVARVENTPVQRKIGARSRFVKERLLEPTVPLNMEQINIRTAWRLTNGSAGIVVGSIDTGVHLEHEALASSYRGYRQSALKADQLVSESTRSEGSVFEMLEPDHTYSWFDPTFERKGARRSPRGTELGPNDKHGHGTHTMGSAVGRSADRLIGVAPGVSWIAAKGCGSAEEDDGGCRQSSLLASAQFIFCPRGRCDLGARVVSNSWGATDPAAMAWFAPVLDVWRAGGLIPVFAAGNGGPDCDSIYAPASLSDVITVGASEAGNDAVAIFSSRSSARVASVKPDVIAPGSNIISSYRDGQYAEMSGTSMACPQVAGLVALMLSCQPDLTFDRVKSILEASAIPLPKLAPKAGACCDTGARPNCVHGWGRLDAGRAVELACSASK